MKKVKTKQCDWCNKRKKVDDMYLLGKMNESDKKIWWICSNCNLEHNVL